MKTAALLNVSSIARWLLLLAPIGSAAAQSTIAVPQDFATIQQAINAALPGATVLVSAGTYNESIDLLGKAITVRGESEVTTIIDGTSLNSSVVRFRSNESNSTVLENFTIQNGSGSAAAQGPAGALYGGGILCDGASPVIRQCIIRNNSIPIAGNSRGGGIAILNAANIRIESCRIELNSTQFSGGGMLINGSTAVVLNTDIVGNAAFSSTTSYGTSGGGMSVGYSSTVQMTGCLIEGNSASSNHNSVSSTGGGLHVWLSSNITLSSCVIGGNFARHYGGGLWINGGTFAISDSTIDNNAAKKGGGLSTSGSGTVVRTVISRNSTNSPGSTGALSANYGNGGGVALGGAGTISFNDCSLVANQASHSGGAISACRQCSGGSLNYSGWNGGTPNVTVSNSIIWDNGGGFSFIDANPLYTTFRFSDVQGTGIWAGIGNINADPIFWRKEVQDYRLTPGSPCIDSGDPAFPSDPDGSPTDMGASDVMALDYVDTSSGTRYLASAGLLDIPAARAFATAVGGHLISIGSASEQSWITGQFGLAHMWIGLSDEAMEGQFLWDNGEPLAYSNWATGEPNNGGGNQDHVLLNFDPVAYAGRWNDQPSTALAHALVEIPPLCTPPLAYCTAGTTTNGCDPLLSATGTPSATANSGFTLSVSGVEGQRQGLVFYSVSGRKQGVWTNGSTSFLCVKAPTQRMTGQTSGGTNNSCDGSFSIDWLAWIATRPTAVGQPLTPGQLVQAQCWFRDPSAPGTTNLSQGVEWQLCP
ncbi:MAG: hypothetical protein HUU28_04125 [Planctomycetaceae bacterium]|nr:hypothetical protein [Planctomycetaceae bacterium]